MSGNIIAKAGNPKGVLIHNPIVIQFTNMMHIVMLDDDDDEPDILQSAFQDARITTEFHWFSDLTSLQIYLHKCPVLPDLLFMDINLPTENGIQCLRRLRTHERCHTLPVIMYSTSQFRPEIEQCFVSGATIYMKKTVSYQTLKSNLLSILSMDMQTAMNKPFEERTFLD